MDSEIVGSIDMSDITLDARSFSWAVDSAIRSDTESNLGASPVHSFGSVVDRAIRSRTPSNLGTSPVRSFSSAVENAMMRLRTVTTRLSQVDVVRNGTGDVPARLFTLAQLKTATNNFSLDNKIGAGSFGVVYRGKLVDGRKVAINRVETSPKRKRAIKSELGILFCLHHKHLVWLVGFCGGKNRRLLVYEYMKNGVLYDHLHGKKGSSVLNSWKMRIKIALDASRGIQYLHNYAVPSIIHGDIKSSNILLDATWTARVSDFGLTFMKKTAGTIGYIDLEYLARHVLTAKSDVYGFGVVLLELLMGKTAMFRSAEEEDQGLPLTVVKFAAPAILAGDFVKILDPRVGPPDVIEAEALELVAHTANLCVNFKGEDRPTMGDIVVNLERALTICYSNPYDSISSGSISDDSE